MKEISHNIQSNLFIDESTIIRGNITGDVTIAGSASLYVYGTINGNLLIKPRCMVTIIGMVKGNIVNAGTCRIIGKINGELINNSGEFDISPSATVSHSIYEHLPL